jgi:branched-chain amino acid transport system substrate-binding protein
MRCKALYPMCVSIVLGALVSPFTAVAQTPGVTATDVTIGTFVDLTGPFALAGRDTQQATEAYFNKVNAAGGVNGRKIKFVVVDDGYVPSRSAAAARRLVEQEGVLAILNPLGTPNNLAAMPYLQSRGVPAFGVHGFSRRLYIPPQKGIYGNWTPFAVQMKIMANFFYKDKVDKLGMIYQDIEAGVEGFEGAKEAAKAHGQEIVGAPVPPGAPDYRAAVLKLRDAGVTHVLLVAGPQDVAKIVTAAREIGWIPKFGGHQGTPDPLTIQLGGAAVEGVYGVATSALPGWDTTSWPGLKEYQDSLAALDPSAKPSAYGVRAYADAMVFVEILKRAGVNPTRESLITAVESLKDFATGIYPPLTYGPDRHDGNHSAVIVQAQGGKWITVSEWQSAN